MYINLAYTNPIFTDGFTEDDLNSVGEDNIVVRNTAKTVLIISPRQDCTMEILREGKKVVGIEHIHEENKETLRTTRILYNDAGKIAKISEEGEQDIHVFYKDGEVVQCFAENRIYRHVDDKGKCLVSASQALDSGDLAVDRDFTVESDVNTDIIDDDLIEKLNIILLLNIRDYIDLRGLRICDVVGGGLTGRLFDMDAANINGILTALLQCEEPTREDGKIIEFTYSVLTYKWDGTGYVITTSDTSSIDMAYNEDGTVHSQTITTEDKIKWLSFNHYLEDKLYLKEMVYNVPILELDKDFKLDDWKDDLSFAVGVPEIMIAYFSKVEEKDAALEIFRPIMETMQKVSVVYENKEGEEPSTKMASDKGLLTYLARGDDKYELVWQGDLIQSIFLNGYLLMYVNYDKDDRTESILLPDSGVILDFSFENDEARWPNYVGQKALSHASGKYLDR